MNFFIVISLTVLFISPSFNEYISHLYQQNLSCIDWKQAPEATVGNCTTYGRYGALLCYGGMNNLLSITEHKIRKLEEILLCGWPSEFFNPRNELQLFPKVRSLTIEYSNVREITFDFPEMFYLQSINISWTNLSYISPHTFSRIYTLKVLDLRWNQLVQLDAPFIFPRYFEKLFLTGNPWNCTRNFKWLITSDKRRYVVDRNELLCTDRKYKDRHLLIIMNYRMVLKQQCQSHIDLKNCTCFMHHIIPKSHTPLYTVNCSNSNFQQLPSFLPENTTMLYIKNNMISDVLPLRNNINYRYVVDVHLDYNQIETIDVLEGGYWLEHFRLLSLRGNKLTKIPVYALNNALENNANANLLLLSMNPWMCSCNFALRFRELLNKYNDILRDASNVTCIYKQNNVIKSAYILSITRQDVCKLNEDSKIYLLDLFNSVMGFLIIIVLSKLGYDYYNFKFYGRVPWIVMRLP